jgi:hypothetical protein
VGPDLPGGGRVVCIRDTIILNDIWEQHNTYILVGISLG